MSERAYKVEQFVGAAIGLGVCAFVVVMMVVLIQAGKAADKKIEACVIGGGTIMDLPQHRQVCMKDGKEIDRWEVV